MLRGYSFVAYNGVLLEITKLVSYKREAVHDEAKVNYQFTRHTLVVRAILAPSSSEHALLAAQLFTIGGVRVEGVRYKPDTAILEPTASIGPVALAPGSRGDQAGISPFAITGLESDNAIRHALMTPRRRLAYVVGPDYIIDSPHSGALVDVSYGPIPLFCHIERIAGMSTVSILFGIQTDQNQCPLFGGLPFTNAVLSHQYSQRVEIDGNFLTRRITKGDIRVRSDVMLSLGINPDNVREYFSPSVPAYYKRDSISIAAHPDMTRLEYVTVDVEQERPIINNFDPTINYQLGKAGAESNDRTLKLKNPLTRVARLEVRHTVTGGRAATNAMSEYGRLPSMPEAFQHLPEIMRDPGRVIAEILKLPEQNAAIAISTILSGLSATSPMGRLISNLRYGTPTISERLEIQVYGSPTSIRYELELIAWYILMQRMPIVATTTDTQFRDLMYAGGSINFTIMHDVMKNFVMMTYEYTRAAPQSYGIGAALTGDNRMKFGPMISGEQSIVGKEIIEGVTLHSYSANHYGINAYDVPAVSLPDNVYNPWGRPGDRMHGADPTPIVVDALQDQCSTPASHDTATFERTPNRDAAGNPMARQPDVSIIPNLEPAP